MPMSFGVKSVKSLEASIMFLREFSFQPFRVDVKKKKKTVNSIDEEVCFCALTRYSSLFDVSNVICNLQITTLTPVRNQVWSKK